MPDLDGIEIARRLVATEARAKVIILTVHDDPDLLRAAIETRAVGHILKSRMPVEFGAGDSCGPGAGSSPRS